MSSDGRKDPLSEINLRLDGLFGELGRALGEAMTRLEEGGGEVRRTQSFQTPKGPIRAEAQVRMRMGGVDVATSTPDPAPVNTPAPAPPPPRRDIAATIVSDASGWSLTAELPGVAREDLNLAQDGRTLRISASGAGRDYAGDFDLPDGLSVTDIAVSLRNGVLDLSAPPPGGSAT